MAARRPNIVNALAELGCACAGFTLGLMGAPWWGGGLAALAALAYWAVSRRAALARMTPTLLAQNVLVGVAVILIVVGGAYGLGLMLRDMS